MLISAQNIQLADIKNMFHEGLKAESVASHHALVILAIIMSF